MAGSETVESSLKGMLPEFLNAEITLRTISDVSQAIQWLKGTFFYTRVGVGPVGCFRSVAWTMGVAAGQQVIAFRFPPNGWHIRNRS